MNGSELPDFAGFEVLIPRTDGRTGEVHPPERFEEWVLATAEAFGGITVLGINVFGLWYDDDRKPIDDHSNWYKVGVRPADVDRLRTHVQKAVETFGQKCIYLERCGEAYLVKPR